MLKFSIQLLRWVFLHWMMFYFIPNLIVTGLFCMVCIFTVQFWLLYFLVSEKLSIWPRTFSLFNYDSNIFIMLIHRIYSFSVTGIKHNTLWMVHKYSVAELDHETFYSPFSILLIGYEIVIFLWFYLLFLCPFVLSLIFNLIFSNNLYFAALIIQCFI